MKDKYAAEVFDFARIQPRIKEFSRRSGAKRRRTKDGTWSYDNGYIIVAAEEFDGYWQDIAAKYYRSGEEPTIAYKVSNEPNKYLFFTIRKERRYVSLLPRFIKKLIEPRIYEAEWPVFEIINSFPYEAYCENIDGMFASGATLEDLFSAMLEAYMMCIENEDKSKYIVGDERSKG